ncbi:MAG: DNA primase [Gammaproteobacteria bacterium]|nr:DNA primase [Gammaproteobacteria bacterium]
MAGKIPNTFIDDLIARVDIVDIIDRRVPLTRKAKEYQACCPFHDEKTPSFTVSPSKQFYHCFGCGAHGTVIGFLMEYANLSFVEAIQELADGMGLSVPTEDSGSPRGNTTARETPGELLRIVEQTSYWFQQQLRNHSGGKEAIVYLKNRGLDGRTAASFGIGYAPDGWSSLATALGTTLQNQQYLVKAGLITKKEGADDTNYYDRFRGRIMFPIEDHRGRTVAFGGRILGQGEPKYLNSPETSLFHKGAELYGLHRARRSIGNENRSIVVEGYMDVISLAQFGVDNSVATLGTATTRTHLQRLFRLAPEIIFCFDGDRAGRSAAWKAMLIALPEMQDGRLTGFLFLPEGEDPDSWIRSKGKEGFNQQMDQSISLPEFLFDNLIKQVDMTRMEGKARLVSLAKPLLDQLPQGALKEMMFARLSSISGLTNRQLGSNLTSPIAQSSRNRTKSITLPEGQLSPLALATSLLLQNPSLAKTIVNLDGLRKLNMTGANVLLQMIDKGLTTEEQTTARLLESFRESEFHPYLEKLAGRTHLVDDQALEAYFNDTLNRLLSQQDEQHRLILLEKSRQGTLDPHEKVQLVELLQTRVAGQN